jgi:predicted O-linked N-acetylglucosamine transferase (SPINDLY family)
MVAPEFGHNPVGHFLIRVMEALDPQACEVYCYSNAKPAGALGERFRRAAGAWRDTDKVSDEALAHQIRDDQIDVLFDLAGHTADNRLLVFARKPAPIQITWIAYAGTTGMEAMDYIIADARVIPPGSEAHYRERVMRLAGGYVCHDPPEDSPAVGPLPAAMAGHVTFGSFNNPLKISTQAASVWAAVLRRVPGARLVIKYFGLADEATRRRIREMLVRQRADAERIDLLGEGAHGELLAAYNTVDIGLDPLPYTGGLTTCEALWMGVPVITCPGGTFAGRHSASHLAGVGLGEWIAADLDQYVELAVKWASDLERLAELRAGLRGRMLRSPLCDGKRLAADLARQVRQAWREWALGQPQSQVQE